MRNVICLIVLCISAASMSGTNKKKELKVIECSYEYQVMKCSK